jgi:hypothetical protein
MTILERLDSRIDNDIQEECLKPDLKRVVRDLLPLRDKDHETQKYCQDYLYTEHKTPEELLPSAIDPDWAPFLRSDLLSIIRDDKDTFGYLYYRLTCEYNNCHHWGKEHPITDNIPDKDNIRAALDKEKLSEQQEAAQKAEERKDTLKKEAIDIFKKYPKATEILEKAQKAGFFDENFNILIKHEQLGVFAHKFCRKMKQAPFTDNGTNFALFDKLFGLKVGTLGKAYREGDEEEFGAIIKKKDGGYGGRYKRYLDICNFFKKLNN